jgi:hypothetical protein
MKTKPECITGTELLGDKKRESETPGQPAAGSVPIPQDLSNCAFGSATWDEGTFGDTATSEETNLIDDHQGE